MIHVDLKEPLQAELKQRLRLPDTAEDGRITLRGIDFLPDGRVAFRTPTTVLTGDIPEDSRFWCGLKRAVNGLNGTPESAFDDEEVSSKEVVR